MDGIRRLRTRINSKKGTYFSEQKLKGIVARLRIDEQVHIVLVLVDNARCLRHDHALAIIALASGGGGGSVRRWLVSFRLLLLLLGILRSTTPLEFDQRVDDAPVRLFQHAQARIEFGDLWENGSS